MARKKDNQVRVVRNAIIGFISTVAILIVGFGIYLSTGLSDTEIGDEIDYREVERPRPRRDGEPIKVVEFFSYTCIHCKTFDPIVEAWAEDQGEAVSFSRSPAMYSPMQTMLGRTYLTLADKNALNQNHGRIFRAIHDGKRQFLTPEMVADYVDGRGISQADFLKAFHSPQMQRATAEADRAVRDFQINSTPSLLVGGQYVVGIAGGQQRALRVAEYLIEKIRKAEASGAIQPMQNPQISTRTDTPTLLGSPS